MGNDPATDNDFFDVAPDYIRNYERNIRQHRIVIGHGRRAIHRKISKSSQISLRAGFIFSIYLIGYLRVS